MTAYYFISGNPKGQPLTYGPAGQAYPSKATRNLVRLMSAIAPKTWAILTYAQGMVKPSELILKPQGNIRRATESELDRWAENTYQQIKHELTLSRAKEVVFLCGAYYHALIAPWIVRDFGIKISCPFDHKEVPEQERWVTQQLQRLREQEQKRLRPCPRRIV